MKIAYSGRRYIHDYDLETINTRMMRDILEPDLDEMFFGGAIGSDSYALRFAYLARGATRKLPMLTVVCPNRGDDLSMIAKSWAYRYADRVIELDNEITAANGWLAFKLRNRYMIDQVRDIGQLTAFWEGRREGGTWDAIEYALATDTCWEYVTIRGQERPL